MRLLTAGSWINTRSFFAYLRMSSPMPAADLQPQVEVRPAGVPFSGHPTMIGATVPYDGSAVLTRVRIAGLQDGLSYHWQVRVHDIRGRNSPWSGWGGVALRVHVSQPAAPALRLVTPASPLGWVATRHLTFRWLEQNDVSGIRGFSYTLSRSPHYQPLMHWRTWKMGTTVQAGGDGRWYFSVRALNDAHTWGPPARIEVRIDAVAPRLHVVSAPTGAINPARAGQIFLLGLTHRARVVVDIVSADGRVIRSIPTHYHNAGYPLTIGWDGLDSARTVALNGRYTARITAYNRASVTWSTTRSLDIETTPPAFTGAGLAQTGVYNPFNNSINGLESITTTVNSTATVRLVAIREGKVRREWALGIIAPGQVITATWDGGTYNHMPLPGGTYTFQATAVDEAGNKTVTNLGSVILDMRRIVVSLNQERLWALDGDKTLMTTLITSGGPELPTPTGDFQIIDRASPFTFHSPYPPSSPFWYADSPTNFALLFQQNGYFLHDAPWRSYYGPGSNSVDGIPGSNTTGTHGCVNVPYDAMAWLWNWATLGTPVQIRQDFAPKG